MIKANHSSWAKRVFDPYLTYLLRRHFHAFHFLGDTPQPEPNLPLLLLPNHSSWWDGFWVYLLNRKIFRRRIYLMMLEKELSRYRYFARLGAYSVNPAKPKSVLASLKYSAELLKERPNPPIVCIFPQGELRPWGKRPLTYKRGVERILQEYRDSVNILPLAIRCEHLNEQRPEVFFLFGSNHIYDANNFPGVRFLEEMEEFLLDDLDLRILYQDKGTLLMNGSLSINRKVDAIRGREDLMI